MSAPVFRNSFPFFQIASFVAAWRGIGAILACVDCPAGNSSWQWRSPNSIGWAQHFFSTHFLSSRPPVSSLRGAVSGRFSLAWAVLLGTVSGHGVRPTTLPRESARHRSLSPRAGCETLSSRLSPHGCALHVGRRQRGPRLAHLRRLRTDTDRYRATALRERCHGRGTGSQPLRAGLDHHRSLLVAV